MATSKNCSGYVLILQGILLIFNCAFTIGKYISLAFRHKLYVFVSKREIYIVCNDQVWYESHVVYQFEIIGQWLRPRESSTVRRCTFSWSFPMLHCRKICWLCNQEVFITGIKLSCCRWGVLASIVNNFLKSSDNILSNIDFLLL